MINRIAITSAGPYAGATTLARELAVRHGYLHISMSDYLIQSFADTYALNADEVRNHKAHWRVQLQEYGDVVGLNADDKAAQHIERMLSKWDGISPVVIEKIRSNSQAAVVRSLGFSVIHLEIQPTERVRRASGLGVSELALSKVMLHHIERKIDDQYIDFTLDAAFSAAVLAKRAFHGLDN